MSFLYRNRFVIGGPLAMALVGWVVGRVTSLWVTIVIMVPLSLLVGWQIGAIDRHERERR